MPAKFSFFRPASFVEVIRAPVFFPDPGLRAVELVADRFTLAKRRWRGTAADGRDFGFDLEQPLRHREVFFQTDTHRYVVAQTPEPLLAVALTSPAEAARTAWQIGNLHMPIEVREDGLWVEDDPIVRALLEREEIEFRALRRVFQPLSSAFGHRH